MKKQKPIYLFAVIISLFIAMSAISLVSITFNGFGFFLLIPIIFFIVIVVFMIVATALSSGAFERKASMSTVCPQCHKYNKGDALYCSYCGTSLSDEIECDFCGAKNPKGSIRCNQCNANLE
jgi:hypothetical protein